MRANHHSAMRCALLLLFFLVACDGLAKFTRSGDVPPAFAAPTSPTSPSKAQACSTNPMKAVGVANFGNAPVARRLFDEDGDEELEADEARPQSVKPIKARPWMLDSAPGYSSPHSATSAASPLPETLFDAVEAGDAQAGFNPREAAGKVLEKYQETVMAIQAWLAVHIKALLSCKLKDFVSETIPQIFSKVMPSRTILKGLSELLMLSVSVWMETIGRIFKLSFSVLLHALWRQGLVIAHSFSRLSADTHIVPNTPILERRWEPRKGTSRSRHLSRPP